MDLTPALEGLEYKQRIYVESRLKGMAPKAAAVAAGYKGGTNSTKVLENTPAVVNAMRRGMEIFAQDVAFGRREAHDMLMEAYRNSTTAAEQVGAVRELIKLHGLAAPIKHQHVHEGTIALEAMSSEELLKLAQMEDFTLEGEFAEVTELLESVAA
jgi:hypothetical protein